MSNSYNAATNRIFISSASRRRMDEETGSLEKLFVKKVSIKEIACELGRGENGVRQKLMNLGLLDRDDVF